jgi:thiol-disulfide isomerase/thioredoxin
MKKMKLTILMLLLFTIIISAQDTNKVVIDESSEKPMLIGNTTREAFEDSSFAWWYDSGYEFYEPDTALIDSFQDKLLETDITAVIGTWCSDSRRELPSFLKILDYAGYPDEMLKLISVDRDKQAEDIDVSELNIELVPTFIFYLDGEEIGRIEESPVETLEEDMKNILEF